MLYVQLALLCGKNVIMLFGVNEAFQAITLCEAIGYALPMFPHSPGEFRCGTNVKRAVTLVCHNVDPSAHGFRIASEWCGGNQKTWVAGPSPATGILFGCTENRCLATGRGSPDSSAVPGQRAAD